LSGINKTNNCKVITPEMDNQIKIMFKGETLEMISVKIKEYKELISIQSPERVKI
jgi:hypothetical protein